MTLTRRTLLTAAGTLLFAAPGAAAERKKTLVCIFLRGGVDSLSIVVPHGERAYYDERPTIAIAAPRRSGGAIALDARFGLHPRLAPLKPVYDAGELAFVHAVGMPAPTRSHFQAQDFMESATAGDHRSDGWLGRCLVQGNVTNAELRALALTSQSPLALRGYAQALVTPRLASYELRAPKRSRAALERAYAAMYENSDGPGSAATREALALSERLRQIVAEGSSPEHGAEYPRPAQGLREIALLIKRDVGLQVGWLDVGGWDTHQDQGNAEQGRLPRLLDPLGKGLVAFRRDLGPRMKDVLVLVMSEFGRTVRENGTGGTDHGHAGTMWLMGGAVRGRKIHGRFPGLGPDQRFEGRDLDMTSDFRDVLAEIAEKQLGVSDLSGVFPGYARDAKPALNLLRG